MDNSAHRDSVLDDLSGAVVTLKRTITETSVIATRWARADRMGDEQQLWISVASCSLYPAESY